MKKKIMAGILTASILLQAGIVPGMELKSMAAGNTVPKETVVEKSTLGNPILGFDDQENLTYGGDPSVLVDGDTVYLYVGHDVAQNESYVMPNYLCYSTQDMENWQYEGVMMDMTDVSWGDNNSAWAGQVMKHNGKYYMYFCSWDNTAWGKQSIGVAVSDSPTGPFRDIGYSMIKGYVTEPETSTWNDIDPTAWIETDENGEEHIYLSWGNGLLYLCELNQDMISVKDQNQDGKITMGDDIWQQTIEGMDYTYTEAPYLYRQQDEGGNYYGPYYLFFAANWREGMAYCTTDDLTDGKWNFGGLLMPPTATSNTNHPAVFDFKGKTYFIYHNGSLPHGSGFRRSVCVEEFSIQADGSIDMIQETSTGLTGKVTRIYDYSGVPVAHENFVNSWNDGDYPISALVMTSLSAEIEDASWEIVPGKADKTKESYVSIESYNKPGLYLSAKGEETVLTQDTYGTAQEADNMTFRTLEGFAGYGVTLESVAKPGYYLVCEDGKLVLQTNPNEKQCTFVIDTDADKKPEEQAKLSGIRVLKTKRTYLAGDTLNTNDLQVMACYTDGSRKKVTGFSTNASALDMKTSGEKPLKVSYTDQGTTASADIKILVEQKPSTSSGQETPKPVQPQKTIPKKGAAYTSGGLKYKVTKSAARNGTVSVTGTSKKNPSSIKIPAEVKINGYAFKVTSIQSKAFYKKTKVKTVTMGKNIKSIGKNAFKNINKKAVFKIPSSRYKTINKLITAKTGFEKKTMKLKKIS